MQKMAPNRLVFTGELSQYNVHQYQSTHCTGGVIMGADPGNSVTNKYGQVWDTPNVFVTGAALYPQNPGANPTETLLALAYLAGDAIRDHYFKQAGQLPFRPAGGILPSTLRDRIPRGLTRPV